MDWARAIEINRIALARVVAEIFALLGLVAGGPTCIGVLLSGQGVSPYLSISFYTLAAGSLLYVIFSLLTISYTVTRRLQVALGIWIGISLMYVTAMLLTVLGGVRS